MACSFVLYKCRVGMLLLIVLIAAGTAWALDSKWEKEKVTRDGIVVYSRSSPGTTVRRVRAQMTVNAPPAVVLEAACDPDTFRETTDKYVEENRFFSDADPNVWYNYQLVNFPVIAKRDYTLRYRKTLNESEGLFQLAWKVSNRHGPSPRKDVVRVTLVEGRIDVAPLDNNKSKLRYTLLADPGGNIPAWLINVANRRSLPDILREIRTASLQRIRVQKEQMSQ